MTTLTTGWESEVERGPDCLFVRLKASSGKADASNLADAISSLLEQHFSHRLVLELDDVPTLPSAVVGQLVLLNKRIHQRDGLFRLCGLSEAAEQTLQASRVGSLLPHFRDRESALMGRPTQPR